MYRIVKWLRTLIVPLALCLGAPALQAADSEGCERLVGQHLGGASISAADWVQPGSAQSLPAQSVTQVPFCRVAGQIESTIGFEIWLPARADWNHRLLGAGVGGSAGTLNWRRLADGVNRGFATASTDTGHRLDQPGWMLDARTAQNYAYRGVHLMTLAAKAISTKYYASALRAAYFIGCSGGGREALKEIEQFPRDYDGVIAGAPGSNMPLLSVRHMLSGLWQQDASEALQASDWKLMADRVVQACDALDGVRDGVIGDPRRCHFELASLACQEGQSSGCLDAPKLELMQKIVSPIRTAGGVSVDDGLLPGVSARPGPPPSLLLELFGQGIHHDTHWDAHAFDPDRDLAAVYRQLPQFRADQADLSGFRSAGGKAILFQGWMDPSVLAQATVNFYEQVVHSNGGLDSTEQFARLFMVPGMLHCAGGNGTDHFGGQAPALEDDAAHDMLRALIAWREQGRAPDEIIAAHLADQQIERTRPLCSYPKQAHFRGSGNPDEASSFECVDAPAAR